MELVSPRASSELLHAEVGYLLRRAGIPCLHIKGPSVALWLYDEGERPWGDVDVLVPPDRVDDALSALAAAGIVERNPGLDWRRSGDHAITLAQGADHRRMGGSDVDLHHRFEGLDSDPDRTFAELWRRREPVQLAHVDVWFPDLTSRALLVAVNAARSSGEQPLSDLRRVLAAAGEQEWDLVVALAADLDAQSALRAGLELDAAGHEVVGRTALASSPVSAEWQLRAAGASKTAVRLEALGGLHGTRRWVTLLRWMFPPPSVIRTRDVAARGNAWRLLGGYLRRTRDGLRTLGPSLAAVRRARVRGTAAKKAPFWED